MRVSLIIARNGMYWQDNCMPPLGLGYLAAYASRELPQIEFKLGRSLEDILEAKPDIAGISSSTSYLHVATEYARRIKEELGVPVILGGVHITALPHTLPAYFDVGVLAEGEITFTELLKLYARGTPSEADLSRIEGICYRSQGRIVTTPRRPYIGNLDELPHPDRDLLGTQWDVVPKAQTHLITSRGCPYACRFCGSKSHWQKYRSFSADYVVNEIEAVIDKFRPNRVAMFDDLWMAHLPRFRKVCGMIEERGLHKRTSFRSLTRADYITPEVADTLAKLNFRHMDFGFESCSRKVLDYFGKNLASPEANQRAVDLLGERGIACGGTVIIGAPVETVADAMETYRFIERNRAHMSEIKYTPLYPYPGTAIWKEALAAGIVSEDMDWRRFEVVNADIFDPDHFPYMGQAMTKAEFVDLCYDFALLTKDVCTGGTIREMATVIGQKEADIARLKRELATIRGSRLMRTAWSLRNRLQSSCEDTC